jgi:hypothetical protein
VSDETESPSDCVALLKLSVDVGLLSLALKADINDSLLLPASPDMHKALDDDDDSGHFFGRRL